MLRPPAPALPLTPSQKRELTKIVRYPKVGSIQAFTNSHCASVSSIPTDVPANSTSHNYLVWFNL